MIEYKNLLVVAILKVLMKYTDENHKLTQKEIVEYVKNEYNMEIDRKSVKRNIEALISIGFNIEYRSYFKKYHNQKTGLNENREFLTDIYFIHDFSCIELNILIDGIVFSKYLPNGQKLELISKLENLYSKYIRSSSNYLRSILLLNDDQKIKKSAEIFLALEVIEDAIKNDKKITFNYRYYKVDKQLHCKEENGIRTLYTINPYYIVASNGRYYLICNNDKFNNISNFRIDRISNIKILDSKRKEPKLIKDFEKNFDPNKYITEHIFMYSSEKIRALIQIDKTLLSEAIDIFGDNINFIEEKDYKIKASVNSDIQSLKQWALQYGEKVKILSPQNLVENMKIEIKKIADMYSI